MCIERGMNKGVLAQTENADGLSQGQRTVSIANEVR